MEILLAGLFATLAVLAFGVTILSLAAPVFWIWMLIDALLREDAEYPNGVPNSRLIWVLLIAFVQFSCILYYFMVYAPARRGDLTATGSGGPVTA